MSLLLDPPRVSGAGSSAAHALLAVMEECAACDLNELTLPELDTELALVDRVAAFFRGRRVVIAAQRA